METEKKKFFLSIRISKTRMVKVDIGVDKYRKETGNK